MKFISWHDASGRLREGEVGVVPTDTIYGIVGSAFKPDTVERIYELRKRERDNPLIVLIGSWDDLDRFPVTVPERTRELLGRVWPGAVSVIIAVTGPGAEYIHRGKGSIAFRMPAKPELRELLQSSGPLVAPSANLAGETPSATPQEAFEYFGDEVFYVDGGELKNPPSALVDARTDPMRVLRPAPGFKLQ